ncbi:cytochrome d ubiquinol oxidase subunit II [Dactylosporangium sp. NPDC049525]|uniref:cytochrome d ubiquinol oxidase subunit II n=1 Tax=Dactylosporangium sp. NPDC049525 TaxID=3154730 RepID=UPI003432AAF4
MAEVPMVFILAGLAAYTVLAGADFGAGLWMLLTRPGRTDPAATRDHARHAMGPVWEANHVWLIFVLAVCWTAYPVVFGSIASTLAAPLFIAAVGIILRGVSYALRGQVGGGRGRHLVEVLFAVASMLTPFALAAAVGGIASGRVPVGNAAGNAVTSWLNPTSVVIGVLGVAAGGHLAAVYLAADARRLGEQSLELDFRARALGSGVVAGGLALAGLLVARADAPALYDGLTRDGGAVMVGISAAAGLATLVLVWRSRFGPSRVTAALAVAATLAGWALAQRPFALPGLTVEQAAAGRTTLLAVIVAVAAGAVVLVPSLVLLFHLFLRGRLDPAAEPAAAAATRPATGPGTPHRMAQAVAAAVTLLAGVVLTSVVGSGWPLAVGVGCLIACAVATFGLATTDIDTERSNGRAAVRRDR